MYENASVTDNCTVFDMEIEPYAVDTVMGDCPNTDHHTLIRCDG